MITLDQIRAKINNNLESLISSQKSAFTDFSSGLYQVPPPIQFIFPNSDCHIKAGYKKGSQNFVVKIAGSGKCGNSGTIFILDVATGKIITALEDNGVLTTIRTAIAGLIVVSILPWAPQLIGIIGSGDLAKQLNTFLKIKYPLSPIMIYARNKRKAMEISCLVADSAEDLVGKCDVIVTATCSLEPMIANLPANKNRAIIALGADDEHKSEVSYKLFRDADVIIVDSKLQASKFGDVSRALNKDVITEDRLTELGMAIKSGISSNAQTIIADFSGIGAQDASIAEFILSMPE